MDFVISRIVQVNEALLLSSFEDKKTGEEIRNLIKDLKDETSELSSFFRGYGLDSLRIFETASSPILDNIMSLIESAQPRVAIPPRQFPEGILERMIVSVSALPVFRERCVYDSLMVSLEAFFADPNDAIRARNVLRLFLNYEPREYFGYWNAIISLAHDLKIRLGVKFFEGNGECLLETLSNETPNDLKWEEVMKKGDIFTFIHVVESQGHLLGGFNSLMHEISRNRDGRFSSISIDDLAGTLIESRRHLLGGFSSLMHEISRTRDGRFSLFSIDDLAGTLKKRARAIVGFWSDKDVSEYEYPHTRGLSLSIESMKGSGGTRIPDFIQHRFIRSHSKRFGFVNNKGDLLAFPEGLVLGSILPFLDQPNPEWASMRREGGPVVALRNPRLINVIDRRMYFPHDIINQAMVTSALTEDSEVRDAIKNSAMALLQTLNELSSIEGGLVPEIDENSVWAFHACYRFFMSSRHYFLRKALLDLHLDEFLQVLSGIRDAVQRRVEYEPSIPIHWAILN